MEYDFTAQVDARLEIQNLLDYNGFSYQLQDDAFALTFEDRGCRWNALMMGQESCAIVVSRYPFSVDEQKAQAFCSKVNQQLLFGSLYVSEGALLCRTCADLFDGYMAYEAIGRALEYNAGVMVSFWADAAALAVNG